MPSKTYEFTFDGYYTYEELGELTTRPGIYCIYAYKSRGQNRGKRKLLYIGSTMSLRDRAREHFSWDWDLYSNEDLCISVAASRYSDIERAEAAMIYKHQPPENTNYMDKFEKDTTKIILRGSCDQLSRSFMIPGYSYRD